MGPNAPIDQGAVPLSVEPPKAPEPSPEEKMVASIGMSKEWKYLKEYLQQRVEFHRAYLPAAELTKEGAIQISVPNAKLSNAELGEKWKIACHVIGEIEGLISQVENITNAAKRRPGVR